MRVYHRRREAPEARDGARSAVRTGGRLRFHPGSCAHDHGCASNDAHGCPCHAHGCPCHDRCCARYYDTATCDHRSARYYDTVNNDHHGSTCDHHGSAV